MHTSALLYSPSLLFFVVCGFGISPKELQEQAVKQRLDLPFLSLPFTFCKENIFLKGQGQASVCQHTG